jgi:hypothetical protein
VDRHWKRDQTPSFAQSSCAHPRRILTKIRATLPQPRNRFGPSFRDWVENICVVITTRVAGELYTRDEWFSGLRIGSMRLHVSSNLLSGRRQ